MPNGKHYPLEEVMIYLRKIQKEFGHLDAMNRGYIDSIIKEIGAFDGEFYKLRAKVNKLARHDDVKEAVLMILYDFNQSYDMGSYTWVDGFIERVKKIGGLK